MKDRIFGAECEYAIIRGKGEDRSSGSLSGEAHLDYVKTSAGMLVSAISQIGCTSAGEFLENGGRFYIDRGGHPEYATPECRSVLDLVTHEKAGDRLVAVLTKTARTLLQEQDTQNRLNVYKNNVDFFGNTFGSHENYLVSPKAMTCIEQIIPFMVTRQIYTGNGRVVRGGINQGSPYQLSQRAEFIDCVFCDRTTQVRGIINTRKREIHRSDENRRLHVIFGDSNMSDYATALKFGTMSLILRVMEEDSLNHIPELENPVGDIKKVSRSFGEPLRVQNASRSYSAIDIQSIYLENVLRFFSSTKPDAEEARMIEIWTETLDLLKKLKMSPPEGLLIDAPEPLLMRIDWLIKLNLLNRWQQQHQTDWNNRQLHVLDVGYHDTDPETGIFARCRQLGMVDALISEDSIHRAMFHSPEDTRAVLRSKIIRQAAGRKVNVQVDNWETIQVQKTGTASIGNNPFSRVKSLATALKLKLKDPFQTDDTPFKKKLDRFLDMWG